MNCANVVDARWPAVARLIKCLVKGLNVVNRLATKGEKYDYRQNERKIWTNAKRIGEIYGQSTKIESFNRQSNEIFTDKVMKL